VSTTGLWALVPLKCLARAKERLAGVLDAAARCALVEAMARDVVAALLAMPCPAPRILLVTDDEGVAALARALGVGLFRSGSREPDPLNGALAEAAEFATGHGARQLLVIHADLPLATPGALRTLLGADAQDSEPERIRLVADRAGTGTNCLLATPPRVIPFRFGADSLARHRAACAAQRVPCRESHSPGIAFDIDLPVDLDALVRMGQSSDNACGNNTRAWLDARSPASV